MTWRLIQDSDSHWYLIPYDSQDEFGEWELAMENYIEWNGTDFDSMRVDGPNRVLIIEWELI